MLCDPENRPLRVVDPVRRKEPAKRRHEHAPAVVGDCGGEIVDMVRFRRPFEVVADELHCAARDGDAAFERVDGLAIPTEVVGYCCEEAVVRHYRFFAHVVEEEAAGAVGVFRFAGREAELAD